MARFPIALLVAASVGCGEPTGVDLATGDLRLQVVEDLVPSRLPADPAKVERATLTGSILLLDLSYSGGCREHSFALVTGTTFAESWPLFTVMRLAHDAAGDLCEAVVRRSIRVDLSPIVPLVRRAGGDALRFELIEPGERFAAVGELRLRF
ncbi:MAG: hypothetical protein ACKVZ0_06935 [Gemmatimonadales bacterium]